MPIPSHARLTQAKHIRVGDTLCFELAQHNFHVTRIEERDEPFPQVRLYSADEALTLVYGPNDNVYVSGGDLAALTPPSAHQE